MLSLVKNESPLNTAQKHFSDNNLDAAYASLTAYDGKKDGKYYELLIKVTQKSGNLEAACKAHESLLSINPKDAKSHYNYGRLLFRLKDYKSALQAFNTADKLDKNNTFCRVTKSKCLIQLKSPETENYISESLKKDPDNVKYMGVMAGYQLSKKNNPEQAVALYEKAINHDPKTASHYLQLGKALIKAERYELAEQALRTYMKMKPEDPAVYIHLGNALDKQYKTKEAHNYIKLATDAYPENLNYKWRLADMDSAMGKHGNAAKILSRIHKANPKDKVAHRHAEIHRQRAGVYTDEALRTKAISEGYYNIHKPRLNSEQQRVLSEATDKGLSFSHIDDLFDDKSLWNEAVQHVEQFTARDDVTAQAQKITSCEDFSKDPAFEGVFKPSIVNYRTYNGEMDTQNPLVKLITHKKILDIVNGYNGCLSKVRNVNLWMNPPISQTNQKTRKGSQIWHRDQEDASILKCFIYFTDVDEKSGAIEYIPYSKTEPKRKYSHLLPYPYSSGYPGNGILDKHVPESDRVRGSGRKGTLVFLDTNGFHRGGFVTHNTRVVLMATFLKPTTPYADANTKLVIENMDMSGQDFETTYGVA